MATSDDVTVRALDGQRLAGTLTQPREASARAVVLVHGGGVTREEGGFFTRLADGLADAGIASVRFDLRGHGASDGRQEELTLSIVLNDIRVILAYLQEATGAQEMSLLGTSFTGGMCAYYAAKQPADIARLVLFNPQLNYKRRTIDNRPFWVDDHLTDEAAARLTDQGYLEHSPTLRHGRAIYNEVFWLRTHEALGEVRAPTLIVHGTKDTFVPVDASRAAVSQFSGPCRLIEIDGAQHGFAVHDDPQYREPQSQEWQAFVIRTTAEFLNDQG
ncbi:alpha/beta hydrolase [Actinacidiphila acididurans]|uniref:Alpha/beta fold hydrolase n=1 Tax=Actinacidiphila acididurans TaxID=2784346 RepID=A0ABS2TW36_9ACTN|nr:alpha/beta fold hydrolase [Actinacidiphila acididurans]MBM9506495.1 alpha/beta fold hydrolase [Actinacidiphila acididurans]